MKDPERVIKEVKTLNPNEAMLEVSRLARETLNK